MKKFVWFCYLISILLMIALHSVEPAGAQDYKLVWSDEFNGDSLNTEIWNFWEGTAYNNELQYYTSRKKTQPSKRGNFIWKRTGKTIWKNSLHPPEFQLTVPVSAGNKAGLKPA